MVFLAVQKLISLIGSHLFVFAAKVLGKGEEALDKVMREVMSMPGESQGQRSLAGDSP